MTTPGRDGGPDVRTVAGFVADALRPPIPDESIRIVTIPAPVASPETLLRDPGPAVFWTTPGDPVHAGLGAAHIVRASGTHRFSGVREAAAELWSRIGTATHPGLPDTPPRLYGGFSFLPGVSPEWRAFGDATFVLPRLHYTVTGEEARLSVAVPAAELVERGADAVAAEVARWIERLAAADSESDPGPGPGPGRGGAVVPPPGEAARTAWKRAVTSIQRRIEAGSAEKIVAARRREVRVGARDPAALLRRLDRESSTAARFAFRLEEAVFLGATPERLVGRHGREVRTEALAGSVPAGSPEREARLLESVKDEAEHGYVVAAIVAALGPLCERLEHPSEPRVQRLRHVVHLQTPFEGRLLEGVHVLELVERLHPTPAVGGLPREEALAWIEREEPGNRGWYAAPVGWFDAGGDGEFGVALRSGLLRGDRAYLYAGAGIVRDSDPASEFAETEVKLMTMLDALGAAP